MSRAALVLAGAASLAALAWLALQEELEGTGLALADHGIDPPDFIDLAALEGAVAPIVAAAEDFIGLGPKAAELHAIASEPNAAAFLAMIRRCEVGTVGPEGYTIQVGGGRFASFADHPRQVIAARGLPRSTAAGAYQFLEGTWDDARRALDLPDFSPASQDAAAVWLIRRRGALADIRAGRFEAAIAKLGREWASLPGSPYGQPTRTLGEVRAMYESQGGTYA